MSYKINQSLEWAELQNKLESPVRKLNKYSDEMLKISKNIGLMVNELSKEEINCRRHQKQTTRHKELLKEINCQIDNYENMITFAVLLTG